jgi:release factor glutamine methyltransferase
MVKYFEILRESKELELLLLYYKGWQKTDLLLNLKNEVDEGSLLFLNQSKEKLKENYPVQYLTKQVDFYDLNLYVDERVLIPRPETEELVALILADCQTHKNVEVLDIGTGSGAIALALKHNRSEWQVTAADISKDALNVAQKNATTNQLDISLVESNLFENINQKFDLIVSNPPYISVDETDLMDLSVLEYEPHLALFAADSGLAIYQEIIALVGNYLKPKGRLYFEIGFNQGDAVKQMLELNFQKAKIDVLNDLFGKQRIVRMILND